MPANGVGAGCPNTSLVFWLTAVVKKTISLTGNAIPGFLKSTLEFRGIVFRGASTPLGHFEFLKRASSFVCIPIEFSVCCRLISCIVLSTSEV